VACFLSANNGSTQLVLARSVDYDSNTCRSPGSYDDHSQDKIELELI
jgi:hypothetical protein